MVINHHVQNKNDALEAKREVNQYILEKWKEREKNNIDNNLDDYVKQIKEND